jgi:3-methyladenine DNA glycosylase AlkD
MEVAMPRDVRGAVDDILTAYDPSTPQPTAEALRNLWLQFDPNRTAESFSAQARAEQEVVGIPIPDLRSIAKQVAKPAARQVDAYLPLMRLLWDGFGREGRVVALIPMGKMTLKAPERMIPLLRELCRSCVTWEDADRLAMDALESVVRRDPERWMSEVKPWLTDGSNWVRRAGVTVVGRLPMKHPELTSTCLQLAEGLLMDEDTDVRRAVSFAIRLSARSDPEAVRSFLERNVPPKDARATWVLCDTIRSMGKKLLPTFLPLLPAYEKWAADPDLDARLRRSVESAARTLRRVRS